jgi:branched-chain amino acid transport system permease protein
MLSKIAFIAVYGTSFGMILFAISVGLAVTMGVMRVINLAHGAFAATGAYLAVGFMNNMAVPMPFAILIATAVVVVISIPVELYLYRPIYDRPELDQVVLTVGLVFISIASLTVIYGPDPVPSNLPLWLTKNVDLGIVQVQIYRLAVIAIGFATIGALWFLLNRTSFGVQLRASVDNRGMAEAIGINVSRVFSSAFALGAGLAALGGAIGFSVVPPEPTYAFKYIVIIFFVVGLAGEGKIMNCAIVALAIGIIDTAARLLTPQIGSYVVYVLAVGLMFYRSRAIYHAT